VRRDAAEVTSAGIDVERRLLHRRQGRWRPIVGSLTAGTSRWRRPQSLSRWDVGDRCELPRVLRSIAMESPISLHGDLENNPFWHSQPMEADMIRSTETKYQSRRWLLHRLESVDKIGREADQCAITIVELTQNQGSDERL